MINVERRFEDALAAFSLSGNRWEGVKGLTYWGAALGMSADDVIAAAHGVGVHSRDADIRRSMVSAAEKVAANAARFSNRTWCASYHNEAPRRSPKPKVAGRVRELIEAGQDVETEDALRAMSPVDIGADDNPMSSKAVCEIQLARLFAPADMVRIRRSKDDNTRSRPGANLKTLGDWLSGDIHPAAFGEIVRVNPLTGKEGLTRDGRASFDRLPRSDRGASALRRRKYRRIDRSEHGLRFVRQHRGRHLHLYGKRDLHSPRIYRKLSDAGRSCGHCSGRMRRCEHHALRHLP